MNFDVYCCEFDKNRKGNYVMARIIYKYLYRALRRRIEPSGTSIL